MNLASLSGLGISNGAGDIIDANNALIQAAFTKLGHQTLTDAATIAMDAALGANAKVTLGGSRTMGAITNAVAGDGGKITFIQDGTGSRLITWHSSWRHAGGTDVVLSTGAGAIDVVEWYTYDGTTFHTLNPSKAQAV